MIWYIYGMSFYFYYLGLANRYQGVGDFSESDQAYFARGQDRTLAAEAIELSEKSIKMSLYYMPQNIARWFCVLVHCGYVIDSPTSVTFQDLH